MPSIKARPYHISVCSENGVPPVDVKTYYKISTVAEHPLAIAGDVIEIKSMIKPPPLVLLVMEVRVKAVLPQKRIVEQQAAFLEGQQYINLHRPAQACCR